MSQFTLDTWTSFARSYNPTPDAAYLLSRGFTNTTKEIAAAGSAWRPVGADDLTLRLMQYPSVQEGFGVYAGEGECEALGYGIDYYETQ